jgi:transcriptional regulator with XRE-family HTH domain
VQQASVEQDDTAGTPRLPAVSGPELGRRLAQVLDERGTSLYALSQTSGLSESHLGDLVAGRVRRPRSKTVVEIARALDIPVDALVGDSPGTYTLVLSLPESVVDVLHALASLERTNVETIASRQLVAFLREQGADEAIERIVVAMEAARNR